MNCKRAEYRKSGKRSKVPNNFRQLLNKDKKKEAKNLRPKEGRMRERGESRWITKIANVCKCPVCEQKLLQEGNGYWSGSE